MKKAFLLFSPLLFACIVHAQIDIVSAMKALQSAKPGDTIVVANGTYKDIEMAFIAKGDAAKPIVIKAQSPGSVIISGGLNASLSGCGY